MFKLLNKISPLTLLALSIFFNSYAQQINNKNTASIPFTILKTIDDTLSINTILHSNASFQDPKLFVDKTLPKDTYWIKLDFKEALSAIKTDSLWYLKFGNFGYGKLYNLNNDSISNKIIGQFEADKEVQLVKFHSEVSFSSTSLFQNRFLYLKVKKVISREYPKDWEFSYISHAKHTLNKDYSTWSETKSLLPIYVFSGICVIMVLLTLAFFIYLKQLEFLFYSLYVFWLLVLISGYELKIYEVLFGDNLLLKYWFYEVVQMFINSAYIFFVMFYLKTKIDYPIIQRLLKFMLVLQILVFVLDTTFLYYEFFIGHIYIINMERLTLIASSTAGLIYLIFNGKNKLVYFIVYGLFFFLIGTIAHFYHTRGSALLDLNSRYYLMIGCALDIIIFAYGLTYKVFLEQNEKLHYQKEAFTNKTQALRAQINPHFIFNSLSSIQNLITSNDRISALKYLSKFSRLTRNILEGSIETNALLEDEINMLNDYLELESLRFNATFNYTINIDNDVDTKAIEIPALIVQPFVENAIIHGLLNKKGHDKKLSITYKKDDDFIICEIDDNGIGRQITSKKESIHRSRGVEVTQERLRSLNKLKDTNVKHIKIIDKKDNEGNSLGTKVIVKIPI